MSKMHNLPKRTRRIVTLDGEVDVNYADRVFKYADRVQDNRDTNYTDANGQPITTNDVLRALLAIRLR